MSVRSGDRLCQTRLIPKSPDGDKNGRYLMMITTSMCFVQSSKVGDNHQQVSDHYYSDDMENDYTEDDDNDNWCTPFISGWHINAMMMTITIITI